MESNNWVLARNGKVVSRGTFMGCMRFIHTTEPYSLAHALKYEGFTLEEEDDNGRTGEGYPDGIEAPS